MMADDPLIGRTLGGCQIRELVGRGAMGRVYRAEQLSLERPVALKILDERYARDSTYVERFFREARSAARLVHANVVQAYDVGYDQGLYYIINEFVEGRNLGEILDEEKRLPSAQVLEVMRQATLALARAEEFGIVHRDIKPENLMVNRHGEVKIADFGLAKRVSEDPDVTQQGMVLGTPYYLSPEQAQGLSVDHRSDIYSLGATAFHLLTGEVPFDAPTYMSVLAKHVNDPVVPPHEVAGEVPRPVSDLVTKMMAKNPRERYANARELLLAIAQVKELLKRGTGMERPKPATSVMRVVPPEEQRRYQRISADFLARVVPADLPEKQAEAVRARIRNISRGGIFIASDTPIPLDTLLNIRFRLPDKKSEVEALGVVRWISSDLANPGIGVQFVKLKEKDQGRVGDYMGPKEAEEALETLTQDAPSRRFLRFYLKNLGNSYTVVELMDQMGLSRAMLEKMTTEFVRWGLIRMRVPEPSSGDHTLITLIPPDNEHLARALNTWLLEQEAR